MPTGQCRHCGYTPVAQNALICPRCAGVSPNPSPFALAAPVIAIAFVIVVAIIFFVVMVFLREPNAVLR